MKMYETLMWANELFIRDFFGLNFLRECDSKDWLTEHEDYTDTEICPKFDRGHKISNHEKEIYFIAWPRRVSITVAIRPFL